MELTSAPTSTAISGKRSLNMRWNWPINGPLVSHGVFSPGQQDTSIGVTVWGGEESAFAERESTLFFVEFWFRRDDWDT